MKSKIKWLSIIFIGLMLIGVQAVSAGDIDNDGNIEPAFSSAADETPLQSQDVLEEIAANREATITDLAEIWAPQLGESVEFLLQTFRGATNEQLLAIDLANSSEDVLEILGDVDKDLVYTPVTPCKILDTRYGGGGVIYSGQTRNYYVHGNLAAQGGTTCIAPQGEPRAVHISMAAVTPDSQGNIKAFPYGASGTAGLTVNFAPIGTNLNNAGTVQTAYNVGYDIGVKSSYAATHVTMQVLGYYYPAKGLAGADYTGGNQYLSLSSTGTTVRSVSISAPCSGKVIVNASGFFQFLSASTLETGRCSITTGTSIDFSYLVYAREPSANTMYGIPFAATRGFDVSSGTTTFRLVCDSASGGDVKLQDSSITAIFVPKTY